MGLLAQLLGSVIGLGIGAGVFFFVFRWWWYRQFELARRKIDLERRERKG